MPIELWFLLISLGIIAIAIIFRPRPQRRRGGFRGAALGAGTGILAADLDRRESAGDAAVGNGDGTDPI